MKNYPSIYKKLLSLISLLPKIFNILLRFRSTDMHLLVRYSLHLGRSKWLNNIVISWYFFSLKTFVKEILKYTNFVISLIARKHKTASIAIWKKIVTVFIKKLKLFSHKKKTGNILSEILISWGIETFWLREQVNHRPREKVFVFKP